MTYHDLTVPLREGMLIYPGDTEVRITPIVTDYPLARVTTRELHLGSHTGTHVDAPLHAGVGGGTVDELPMAALLGPATVLDLRGVTAIGPAELEAAGSVQPRVLLRTDNSQWIRSGPIPAQPAHLTEAGAQWLLAHNVVLVGIDGLSVDAPEEMAVHLLLLRAGVVLLETLDLTDLAAGEGELTCLPLRLEGGDGAPARVVLKRPAVPRP